MRSTTTFFPHMHICMWSVCSDALLMKRFYENEKTLGPNMDKPSQPAMALTARAGKESSKTWFTLSWQIYYTYKNEYDVYIWEDYIQVRYVALAVLAVDMESRVTYGILKEKIIFGHFVTFESSECYMVLIMNSTGIVLRDLKLCWMQFRICIRAILSRLN